MLLLLLLRWEWEWNGGAARDGDVVVGVGGVSIHEDHRFSFFDSPLSSSLFLSFSLPVILLRQLLIKIIFLFVFFNN